MAQLTQTQIRDNGAGWNDVIQFETSAGVENAVAARAWCNANTQGVFVIRRSFNIDTIGDGGTGYFNVNFTNAFTSANTYSIACAANNSGNVTNIQFVGPDPALTGGLPAVFAAGEVAIVARGTGGNQNDTDLFTFAAFGT